MRYRLRKTLKGFQPIYVLDGRVVLVRRSTVYLADLDFNRIQRLCSLPHMHPVIGRFGPRLLQRVFRLGIESAALGQNDELFIARRSDIYRVSLSTGQWSLDLRIPDGRRLLNLAVVTTLGGGADALAFGEYFNNPAKLPVNIWRREINDQNDWKVSATFAEGEIEHVHNISQALDGSIRVLTGDFGVGAGMWLSNPDLDRVEPLHRGSQMIRACWLRHTEAGELYFATDSQFEQNVVRRLPLTGRAEPETFASIEGSSIYSAQGSSRIFFSSTVEPGDGTGSFLRDLVDRVPGPGINGDQAVIYGLEGGQVTEIVRARKDFWPMRLAQFGTFQFPQGTMPDDRLLAFGMGVRGFDGATLCLERLE